MSEEITRAQLETLALVSGIEATQVDMEKVLALIAEVKRGVKKLRREELGSSEPAFFNWLSEVPYD